MPGFDAGTFKRLGDELQARAGEVDGACTRACVIHGDYRMDNLVFSSKEGGVGGVGCVAIYL